MERKIEGEMDASSESSRGFPSVRTPPAGILRTDFGILRRTSMDLKYLSQIEPSSPQPSVDRLSVTFADESLKSEKSMDKVRFPSHTDEENSDEEDYSASVTAIIQRRASTRKSKKRNGRRGSSPFSPDILPENQSGRRISTVTISSGDTAITMEDSIPSVTQEQIFENIKLHKEVLSSVKMQPWNMRKKLRLVMQAKTYIKKHEGALQERLAQSHSTKDMLARWNIYLVKKWQHCKREAANVSNWLIPWELRIKEIESHFGSVVASYFIFLRWLFWVNMVISSVLVAFVAVPEMLTANFKNDTDRKFILPEDKYNSTNFLTLWDFEGIFKYSPMFYGWYTNLDNNMGYRLPLAYFFTGLVVYAYSFVAILRKMAKNSRMSKLSEKEDECIFSWKLFTGWDYMIGNAETAHNRVASIVMGFKEALLEEAEKKRESQSWKIIGIRVLVNSAVLGLLAVSAFAVVTVVARSKEKEANSTTWRRNEITVVLSLISLCFPIFFEVLGFFEQYHPRKQLRLQLARIMVLNLLNLYSLMFALFGKINDMTKDLQSFKPNTTVSTLTTTSQSSENLILYPPYPTEGLESANLISNLLTTTFENLTEIIVSTSTSNTFGSENITDNSPNFTLQDFLINVSLDIQTDLSTLKDAVITIISAATENENSTNFDMEKKFSTTEIPSTEYEEILENSFSDEILSSSIFPTKPSTTNFPFEPTEVGKVMINKTQMSKYERESRLRSLCWETMFGQELVKLTVMDLVFTVLSTLAIDFFRGLFVRYMNNCWCWDLEKGFPQYGDFKVAENILHLVNNQGMVWMGMFFSPGLVILNLFKLYIMMYLRSWAVLTCNVPHAVIFRASRSNNFYFALLLMMLFLCVLPVGYTIVWLEPSWHCGPFSNYNRIFYVFTKTIKNNVPKSFHKILDYIASPGIVIPLLMLLILIIYYLISLTNALREANNDLKIQLRRERTEERRKVFQLADRRRRGGSEGSTDLSTPFSKWKKITGIQIGKSFEDSPKQDSIEDKSKQRSTLSRIITRTIHNQKKLQPEKEPKIPDDTDTDQHDSLPDDINTKEAEPQTKIKISNESSDPKHVKIKENRKSDSINSNWSENIPVIKISKTESSECILESKIEIYKQTQSPEMKIKIDVEKEKVENAKPRIKYVLKKQAPAVERDEGVNEDRKCFNKSGDESTKTIDTNKTESSSDYKDSTFSN